MLHILLVSNLHRQSERAHSNVNKKKWKATFFTLEKNVCWSILKLCEKSLHHLQQIWKGEWVKNGALLLPHHTQPLAFDDIAGERRLLQKRDRNLFEKRRGAEKARALGGGVLRLRNADTVFKLAIVVVRFELRVGPTAVRGTSEIFPTDQKGCCSFINLKLNENGLSKNLRRTVFKMTEWNSVYICHRSKKGWPVSSGNCQLPRVPVGPLRPKQKPNLRLKWPRLQSLVNYFIEASRAHYIDTTFFLIRIALVGFLLIS